jgi:hypothetical protein
MYNRKSLLSRTDLCYVIFFFFGRFVKLSNSA